MSNLNGTLKDVGRPKAELVFDESEFSIQRDLNYYSAFVITGFLLLLTNVTQIVKKSNHTPLMENPQRVWIFIYIGLVILFLPCQFFPYIHW